MLGIVFELVARQDLDDPTQVHDSNVMTYMFDDL